MNNKTGLRYLKSLALLVALATTACGSDSDDKGTSGSQAQTVEIYSWWTAGGEAQALSELIDLYKTEYPGSDVLNSTSGEAADAFTAMNARLAEGDPPDSWQAILGKNLLSYTRFVPADAADGTEPVNMTADLSDLYESEGWTSKIPPGVLAGVKDGSGIYAVPMSISRINDLYYNKKIFDDNGLTPPETFDDLMKIGEKLVGVEDADGNPVIPMVISSGYDAPSAAWPVRFVFDAIMMSEPGGIQFRQDYYAGKLSADDAMYTQSAKDFTDYLSMYTNANPDLAEAGSDADPLKVKWEAAADMVHSGRAAMFLHGDWAKAYLESKGDVADTDFGVVQFPKTAFVYSGDSFVVAKDAPHKESAMDFLKLIASPEAQSAFNKKKGALPARTDADTSDYDTIGQQAAEAFRDPTVTLVATAWEYPPKEYWSCWEDSVFQAVQDQDPVAFAAACADQYELLK